MTGKRRKPTAGYAPARSKLALAVRQVVRPRTGICLTLCILGVVQATPAAANPEGGNVVAGDVEISQASAKELDILQESRKAIVEWQSFSIAADETVNITQPGADALLLNRVTGDSVSDILGTLRANGRVLLVNPNGVFIGQGASIDAGGLVASTADIDNANFLAERYQFDLAGNPSAAVINHGRITVKDLGLVALVAPSVTNSGVITARLGRVSLAAGDRFTLDLYGDRLVNLVIDGPALEGTQASVTNSGDLLADGGIVHVSSAAAAGIVDQVINMSGYVQARSVGSQGGAVMLEGGNGSVHLDGVVDVSAEEGAGGSVTVSGAQISVSEQARVNASAGRRGDGGQVSVRAVDSLDFSGQIDARGGTEQGNGGFVDTSADLLTVRAAARVDTSAEAGVSGTWLLDPVNLSVVDTVSSAGEIAADAVETGLSSGNVVLEAEASITVDAAIDTSAQTAATQLTFTDENSDGNLTINLNAAIDLGANQTLAGEGSQVNVAATASIQDGVDVAATNATVSVAAGSYNESVTVDTAGLTLAGAQAGVDARGRSAAESALTGSIHITGNADGATVDGMTLLEGENVQGSLTALYLNSGASGITVENTRFARSGVVDGDTYRGIVNVFNGGQTGLVIRNNAFSGWATGVFLNPVAGSAVIQDNDFEGNFVGVSLDGPEGVLVTGNRFADNLFEGLGVGPGVASPSASISGNSFDNNTVHVGLYDQNLNLDLSDNNFDGVDADAMSTAELLALETKIGHGVDSTGGYSGFASLRGGHVFVTDGNSISTGLGFASAGDTVNIADGNYDLAGQQLLIDTAGVSLLGESEAGVLIDASAVPSSAGVLVHSDGVTLENLTIQGPTANTFGLKLRPLTDDSAASYTVRNVTVQGSGRTEIDILGVTGAVLENVTADGQDTGGVGIAITDSHNIDLSNITTRDNQWGGIGIFSAGRFATGGTSNITLSGSNSLNESNPLYAENDVDSGGTFFTISGLELEGFEYTVQNSTFRGDSSDPSDSEEFTFFQRDLDDAVAFALSLSNPQDSVVRQNASGTSYVDTDGDVNLDADGDYFVGSDGGVSMSIQAALDVTASGDTVNVLAGSYLENLIMATPDVTLSGASGALLQVGLGETGVSINADGITVTGLSIDGPFTDPFTQVDWDSVGNAFGMTVGANVSGVNIVDNTISNTRTGVSFFAGSSASASGNVIDNTKGSFLVRSDGISLSGNAFGTSGNEWDIVFLDSVSDGAYATSPHVDEAAYGAAIMTLSSDNGGMHVLDRRYGSNGLLGSTPQFGNRSHVEVAEGASFTATDDFNLGNGLGNQRQPLAGVNDALDAAVAGAWVNIGAGTYAETVNVTEDVNLIFDPAGVTVDGLIVDGDAAVGLSGTLDADDGLAILGDAVLLADLSIDTSGGNGAVNFAGSLDGSTDSGEDLNIDAGAGLVRVTNVGQSVRLGDVVIVSGDFDASAGSTSVASMSVTASGDVDVGQSTLNSLFSVVLNARNILGRIISQGSVSLGAGGSIDTQVVAQEAVSMFAVNSVVANISTPQNVNITADSVNGSIEGKGVSVAASNKVTLDVAADEAVDISAEDIEGSYTGGS